MYMFHAMFLSLLKKACIVDLELKHTPILFGIDFKTKHCLMCACRGNIFRTRFVGEKYTNADVWQGAD